MVFASAFLLASASLFAAPQNQFANIPVAPASDFEYELTANMSGVRITKYKGNAQALNIPAEIEGMPVIELKEKMFYDDWYEKCSPIVTVIIPDSVKNLPENLFYECRFLKAVKLPNGIKEIPSDTFYDCSSLTEFTIPATVTHIGSSAFSSTGLRSIVIPDSVQITKDDSFMFSGCHKLSSIKLPASMKIIPFSFFSNCDSLKTIDIPNGVEIIDGNAFNSCSNIEQLKIPDSVKGIGAAFWFMSKLKSIVIPDSVTFMNGEVFQGCSALETVRLSDSVKELSPSIFKDCTSLKSFNLPKSLVSFKGDEPAIPKSVTEIIVPDGLKNVDFNWYMFAGIKPSLINQKKLKDAGYTGEFKK